MQGFHKYGALSGCQSSLVFVIDRNAEPIGAYFVSLESLRVAFLMITVCFLARKIIVLTARCFHWLSVIIYILEYCGLNSVVRDNWVTLSVGSGFFFFATFLLVYIMYIHTKPECPFVHARKSHNPFRRKLFKSRGFFSLNVDHVA